MPELFLPSIFLIRRRGWHPDQLAPTFWPGGFDPARGHLYQDAPGVSPAVTPGDRVGLVHAQLDASQASPDASPRVNRAPPGGRGNMLLHSEDFGAPAWAGYFVKPARSVSPDSLSDASATQRLVYDPSAHESHFSGVFFNPTEAPAGAWSYRLKFRFADRIPAVVRIGMDDGLSGAQTLNGQSIAPDGDNLAALLSVGVVYTLEGRAATAGSVNGRALQIYFQDEVSDEIATFDIAEVQSEPGNEPTGYERVGSAHDVVEPGAREVWHLSDDGGASLSVVFPAATYTRAFVDALGAVTIESDVSIGGMQDVLRADRLADVLYVARTLTAAEVTRLIHYWQRRYSA